MRKFTFNKIVRNRIPEAMRQGGTEIVDKQLTDEDTYQPLLDKLIEEAQEAKAATGADRADELADVRAVLQGIIAYSGVTHQEIATAEQAKATKYGDYTPAPYIASVAVTENDPWLQHYLESPDKYPEIDT